MFHLSWHSFFVILSFFASIAGLLILNLDKHPAKDDVEAADNMLIMMAFTYWLVYCSAFGLQKMISPNWETALLSIKLTGVIAYLLTASCVLSLPLNRISLHQAE